MKADVTRTTFDPLKHFTRVLMQQGRVQLDADWNEQTAIALHGLRVLAADLVGPVGGPEVSGPGGSPECGFSISALSGVVDDIAITPGRYYVKGIACELNATAIPVLSWDVANKAVTVAAWTVDDVAFAPGQYVQLWDDSDPPAAPNVVSTRIVGIDHGTLTLRLDADVAVLRDARRGRLRRLITYRMQADMPQAAALVAGSYHVYLDVWERLITALEDDSIREVALHGADTATRGRVVCQVKLLPSQVGALGATCLTPQALTDRLQAWNRARLRARTKPSPASADPCIIAPDARYRGPENQLYRVEIHSGTEVAGAKPTFKWSRENAAVVFPIDALSASGGTTTVTLANLGRDDRFGLSEGDIVEIEDEVSVLANSVGQLLVVVSIDRGSRIVTLQGTAPKDVGADPTRHPLLRRWDHKAGDSAENGLQLGSDNGALIPLHDGAPGTDPGWLNLEDGVQVQFVSVPPGALSKSPFRSGDYWLIPARTATGDVEWPAERTIDSQGNPTSVAAALPPNGIEHHYAPLAVVTVSGNGPVEIKHCHSSFKQLAAPQP